MRARFEWDPAKAANNLRKHGIRFEIAMRVFADPFALTDQDRIEGSELRWQTIGMVDGMSYCWSPIRHGKTMSMANPPKSSASFPPPSRPQREKTI